MKKHFYWLSIMVFVVACHTVPITGRKQLKLVNNSELLPLSFSQYNEVLAESELSKDVEKVNQIKTIGANIQKAAEKYYGEKGISDQLSGYSWEFNLIESDQVNAWCMPGGKVAFYTGILPICQTEAGIAVVMGHEIAHALANHGSERMSQAMVAQYGMTGLDMALGENPTLTKDLFKQAVGLGANAGMLKFSRGNESESDHIGLILMAMAGYDPNEAVEFWKRMDAMSGGNEPMEFLSTHPSHDTRVSDLKTLMPEAMKFYKP